MKKGFTLLELMIVVIIIGVLAAIAIPTYTGTVEKARAAEAIANMAGIKSALLIYEQEANTFENAALPTLTTPGNLTVETKGNLWEYAITAQAANTFTIRASRGGDITNDITMTYDKTDGTVTWDGAHPGVPRQ